jgi:hypothetical protein
MTQNDQEQEQTSAGDEAYVEELRREKAGA